MVFPALTWVLLAVAAVICALGFIRFVWFMSVGYGLSVAGLGLAILVIGLIRGDMTWALGLQCVLAVVYGCRLGLFLLIREMKSAAYRKTLAAQTDKPVPLPVKIVMWLFMAVLYVCQVSPLWYREATAPQAGIALSVVGAVIMLCGIVIEAVADRQKSAAKAVDPKKPAMTGLYKFSRCPNYFGEVVFWTGIFVSGLNVLTGWQWVIAVIGYICIVFIMVSGVKRLEKRQNKNYADLPEYREYVKKTPVFVPFVPVYSLLGKKK